MKISEVIQGLSNTLANKGDLDVFFCVKQKDGDGLNSIALISGGFANDANTGAQIAWVSSEDLTEFFSKVGDEKEV